jgi:hypothetical protein
LNRVLQETRHVRLGPFWKCCESQLKQTQYMSILALNSNRMFITERQRPCRLHVETKLLNMTRQPTEADP